MVVVNFNANDVDPADSEYSVLPVGEYKMAVSASEIRETKDNPDNKYLKLTFEVLDGKYKGRKIFENMNLWREGSSEKDEITVRIAEQNLSSLCRAVGVGVLKDTLEIHNKPLLVAVKISPASAYYGESNSVRGYKSINGGGTLPIPSAAALVQNIPEKPAPMPWE